MRLRTGLPERKEEREGGGGGGDEMAILTGYEETRERGAAFTLTARFARHSTWRACFRAEVFILWTFQT